MAEDLKACPFCGGEAEIERVGTARMSTIYFCTECSCRLETGETFNHGELWNRRAQLSQGGEAVEVVAYHGKDPDGGEGFVGSRWPNAFGQECIVEPLMTVAQHQRILAAATHPADQVAEGVVVPIKLLKIIEQSWRIPNGCPKSVSEEVGEIIGNGLAELRALLNGGRS